MLKDNFAILLVQILLYISLTYFISFMAIHIIKTVSYRSMAVCTLISILVGVISLFSSSHLIPVFCCGAALIIGITLFYKKSGISGWFVSFAVAILLNFTELELLLRRVLSGLDCGSFRYYSYAIVIIINLTAIVVMLLKNNIINHSVVNIIRIDFIQDKESRLYIILLQISYILILAWQVYFYIEFETSTVAKNTVTFIFTIFVFSILILLSWVLLRYIIEKANASLDRKYKEDVREFIRVLRSQRHDFNFHIESILGMLESQEYDACKSYLSSMLKETRAIAEIMPLDDPAVSALLNTMKEEAAMKGIKISYFIYYDMAKICCSVYEINKVLGNLIRNAVDEVSGNKEENAWVHVTILRRRNYCILRVANPVKDISVIDERLFAYGYSTKENHSGIGLATVKKIVSAYNGSVFPEIENNVVNFIVKIPLVD